MIKLVLLMAFLAALAFGFSTLADMPGHVLLQWGDTEFRVTLITGLVALLAAVFLLVLLWNILSFVFRLPSLVGLANRMRRRAKGHQALSRGLVAVGAGDGKLAERHARDAQKLLGTEPLTLLLRAQSAQLAGDRKGAEEAFRAMVERPETQSLGFRGLFVEAERRDDPASARLFAEEALRRSPEAAWAGKALLGFRAAEGDWRGAIGVIDQGVSRRLIDREEGRAQRAVLLAAAAEAALESNPDEAQALALEALRHMPGLLPAAVIAARRLSAKGDFGKASKILEAAWKLAPHPDLAEAYLGVRQGDSAQDRLKRARALQKLMPHARESRFAVARAAIDAREFGAAREALEALALEKPTARTCLLMAELEEIETGNQGLVRSWLARAARAPRDPAWVADGMISDHWKPVSPVTGRIGAFEWRDPPQAIDTHLRARIDADRFESPPPAAAEAPVLIEAEPVAESMKPVSREQTAEAADFVDFRPIIPDDPGPDPSRPKPGPRFRLFG